MSAPGWTKKVFRLRGLPLHLLSRQDAANLLGEILCFSSDHIIIYSLATSSNLWGRAFKEATVQFKKMPPNLNLETLNTDWKIPIPGSELNEELILDTHFTGMTVLNDVETEKHIADCIAISGLGSHPFGSWQPHGPDKSFMWIRDELPRSVPGVRAVLYGYDSQIIGSDSFQSISDIAISLILNLKSGGWNLSSSRPIIFLAHSLGGIVLKEAIVQMADNNNQSVAGTINNLLGAIMFGVPSLGMQQSHLMAMVEGQANEMLVQDLSRENGGEYVRKLDKSFNGLSIVHVMKIFWAYETKESPTTAEGIDGSWCKKGPLAILVNTDSATCHYHRKDKSLIIPINKDHSSMVKFSRGDSDLGNIIISIRELCSLRKGGTQPSLTATDASQSHQTLLGANMKYLSTGEGVSIEENRLLEDLGSFLASLEEARDRLYLPELDYRVSQIEDPFRDTFEWIFDLDLFTRWLREGSGLFWITGKPGSGKSTLMKYIFQSRLTEDLLHDWKKSSLDIKAGFFFHYRGSAMQKSFEGVLRSLIIQILQPHSLAFQKQYQKIWETYQGLKMETLSLEKKKEDAKYQLNDIIAIKALKSSERVLKEQLNCAKDDTGSGARDIKQQLGQVRTKLELVKDKSDAELEERQSELQLQIIQLQADIAVVPSSIVLLAKEARPFWTQPETIFLRSIVEESNNDSNSHIRKLERILSLLLDQDVKQTDLMLFFDALDEFDGHPDKMSGFLESLVKRSAISATRVKVCFSSRPWKSLNVHFANYPGFELQDHTKADIEQYAMGSLAILKNINSLQRDQVTKVIPLVIARANGVFLWVRLAMEELFDTVTKNSITEVADQLQQRLLELPTDLFEFYKLIIDRISGRNRRYTFALLELLARHAGPPATATDIWGAVLISNCVTLQESLDALQIQSRRTNPNITTTSDWSQKATNDILAWGGGLVEIKGRNHLQLMHQTVLEFTMSLKFKGIVMGDVAAILHENGHSFYLKYWVTKSILRQHKMTNILLKWLIAADSLQLYAEQKEERKLAAYHAEKSESTTGMSQIDFICSVPISDLERLLHTYHPIYDKSVMFLTFTSTYGLTLCIRDWIDRNPDELRRISLQPEQPPLLASLALDPASGDLHEGHLATARLLLENGYRIAKDTEFFPRLVGNIGRAENDSLVPSMQTLVTLVLGHGQDPDMLSSLFFQKSLYKCTALHVAPPDLAAELIRCNANVNASDSMGKTPLDWALKPPKWWSHQSSERRYKLCCLLVNAGGLLSASTPAKDWMDILAEFDSEGFDTQVLRSKTPLPSGQSLATSLFSIYRLSSSIFNFFKLN